MLHNKFIENHSNTSKQHLTWVSCDQFPVTNSDGRSHAVVESVVEQSIALRFRQRIDVVQEFRSFRCFTLAASIQFIGSSYEKNMGHVFDGKWAFWKTEAIPFWALQKIYDKFIHTHT